MAKFSASRAASGPENQIPIPDYDRHFALIAEVFCDGREVEIGVARYVVADREECAEIAVEVADARQRQGAGERLLGGLIQVAARRGLRWLEGEVLVRWKSTMNCGNTRWIPRISQLRRLLPRSARFGASATTKIRRSEFGLTWNAPLETGGILVGDDLQINLEVSPNKGLKKAYRSSSAARRFVRTIE